MKYLYFADSATAQYIVPSDRLLGIDDTDADTIVLNFEDMNGSTGDVSQVTIDVASGTAKTVMTSIGNAISLARESVVVIADDVNSAYIDANITSVTGIAHNVTSASSGLTLGGDVDATGAALDFDLKASEAAAISFDDGGSPVFTINTATNGVKVNGLTICESATGTAAGGGIDAVSPTITVGDYNSEIVTTIFIDIGAGLILSSSSEGDVIGEDGVANAFVTRITEAVNGLVYAGEVICLEVPTTGDPDVNVCANASGTIAEDADGEGEHVLANCGIHTLGLRTALTIPSGGISNDFIYLTHGGTTAGTYNAGKFLIRFFGAKTTGL